MIDVIPIDLLNIIWRFTHELSFFECLDVIKQISTENEMKNWGKPVHVTTFKYQYGFAPQAGEYLFSTTTSECGGIFSRNGFIGCTCGQCPKPIKINLYYMDSVKECVRKKYLKYILIRERAKPWTEKIRAINADIISLSVANNHITHDIEDNDGYFMGNLGCKALGQYVDYYIIQDGEKFLDNIAPQFLDMEFCLYCGNYTTRGLCGHHDYIWQIKCKCYRKFEFKGSKIFVNRRSTW